MWTCVLVERMLSGESSTVLIFQVRCSFFCTTVKPRKMNKIWELEIWDIKILKRFGTK